jgi:hypothetical protein
MRTTELLYVCFGRRECAELILCIQIKFNKFNLLGKQLRATFKLKSVTDLHVESKYRN